MPDPLASLGTLMVEEISDDVRTNSDGSTYVEGMTPNPYMPADRALVILQEVATQARDSDLLEVLTEVPIEDIREAFKTACKYLFIQTLDLKGTEARRRREAREAQS